MRKYIDLHNPIYDKGFDNDRSESLQRDIVILDILVGVALITLVVMGILIVTVLI